MDAIIPVTKRIEAVERGHEMTSTHDGILGVDHLSNDIKFIYNHACNMLANQNSDVNWAAGILEDESKCEYIVGSDWFLSSSAKYCDLLLPEIMPQEGMENHIAAQTGASIEQLVYGQQVQEAPGGVQKRIRMAFRSCRALWHQRPIHRQRFQSQRENSSRVQK